VPGEGQELGIEANRIAHALEHDALEVVIEKGPGQPAKRDECLDVTAQEHAPRVAQHDHEAHQRTPRTADLQVPEVPPVDLCLFAG
jgi:hypothetical protein